MTMPLLIERILLVAGAQDTGKSVQLRSMFRDPRLGTRGAIPEKRNMREMYRLSKDRHLYVRLTSPHERNESLREFMSKTRRKMGVGRWNFASAVQVEAANRMPNLERTVKALGRGLSPERIRVMLLSPDRHGVVLPKKKLLKLHDHLRNTTSCEVEVITIDARNRKHNGLLLFDTFDFA